MIPFGRSGDFFEFGAKIYEALLLGKAPREWLPSVLGKNALCGLRRLLEIPVAEMVNCRAQEQAFPATTCYASIFERVECLL